MSLNQIINVQITSDRAGITQKGFGTMLVLGESAQFAERVRYYTEIDGVAVDLDETDPEYKAALAAFSQTPRPERVAIGRKDGAETYTVALNAIELEQPDWYALVIESRDEDDITECATWVEARKKIFGACSEDAGILAATTTDIAATLKGSSRVRTFVIYSEGSEEFPEAAWLGQMLPQDPGSATFKFKTLSGITPDNLTSTESANAKGKNANTYEQLGGVGIASEGTVAVGEFIDKIIGIDWLEARIQERIFQILVNVPKIPYTDAGTAVIESALRAQLQEGVDNKFLSSNPPYEVSVPKVLDVNPTDRGNRLLPDVEFTAQVAGAIHKLIIHGRVTV